MTTIILIPLGSSSETHQGMLTLIPISKMHYPSFNCSIILVMIASLLASERGLFINQHLLYLGIMREIVVLRS